MEMKLIIISTLITTLISTALKSDNYFWQSLATTEVEAEIWHFRITLRYYTVT